MILSFFRFLLWALAAVFIVQMGWDEPLSYLYQRPDRVPPPFEPLSSAPAPATAAAPTLDRPAKFVPRGSSLDRPAYRTAAPARRPEANTNPWGLPPSATGSSAALPPRTTYEERGSGPVRR